MKRAVLRTEPVSIHLMRIAIVSSGGAPGAAGPRQPPMIGTTSWSCRHSAGPGGRAPRCRSDGRMTVNNRNFGDDP